MSASRSVLDNTSVTPPALADDALGLSTAHNAPFLSDSPTLTAAVGGSYAELRPAPLTGRRCVGGGTRGKVTDFSKASRRRLLRLLNSVDRESAPLPYFVTLTYHRTWPHSHEGRKRHLDAFRKRLERKLGRFSSVWRLEFQKRGAPHYHLLLFLEPGQVAANVGQGRRGLEREALTKLQCMVSWFWNAVAEPDSREHLAAGTNVQRVRSWRGVNAYAAKYMGKLETLAPSSAGIGRFWGVWRRDLLPISYEHTAIEMGDYFRLRRVFRRFSGIRVRNSREHRGLSCFLAHAAANRLLAYYGYYRN